MIRFIRIDKADNGYACNSMVGVNLYLRVFNNISGVLEEVLDVLLPDEVANTNLTEVCKELAEVLRKYNLET